MCGIIAVISKRTYGFVTKDVEIFTQLLKVGEIRGEDATGVITVMDNGDFYIDKEACPSYYFLLNYGDLPSNKRLLKDGYALIGHNRKATVGKRVDESAHPFVVKDHFAMVHNGSLYNHEKLAKTDVDSEALAIVLEEVANSSTDDNDMLEHIGEVLDEVYGAYACVWYNQKTNKIQFLRNSQRPLCYAETSDAYYLASEPGMLGWILGRNQVYAQKMNEVSVDTLYSIDLGKHDHPLTMEKIPIKKSAPTTATQTGEVTRVTGAGSGQANTYTSGLSKSAFRKMKRENIGRYLDFWVYDYLETEIGNPACENFHIVGECEVYSEYTHTIRCTIATKKFGFTDFRLVADEIFFRGTIIDMTFDGEELTIYLDDATIRIVPPSIQLKDAHDESTTALCKAS